MASADALAAVDAGREDAVRKRSRSRSRRNSTTAPQQAVELETDRASTPSSSSSLVADAIACLGELPPKVDRAHELFQEALRLQPHSIEVLDAFGAFLSEEGDKDRAVELLERSVTLQPDVGPEKYLYLAQMTTGEQALAKYEKGIELLSQAVSAGPACTGDDGCTSSALPLKEQGALRKQLARSCASVAELYMTDLCDLPDAEDKCEVALSKGIAADEFCLELQATTAALRKVQGRIEEAKRLATQCAKGVEECYRAQNQLSLSDEAVEEHAAVDAMSDEDVVQLCRVLIDLLLVNEARSLLELLLAKDEEDIQVWILLSYSHVVEKDGEGAKECVAHAFKLCKKLGKEADCWKPMLRDLLRRSKQLMVASVDKEDDWRVA